MKRRVITTRKILVAMVVAGAAGCSRPATEITPTTAEAVQVSSPAHTGTVVFAVPLPPSAQAPAPPDPPPVSDANQEPSPAAAEVPIDQARLRLRGELESVTLEQAVARLSHFRPLCDDKGFPLVGNVIRKAPIETQPSELCGVIRARHLP